MKNIKLSAWNNLSIRIIGLFITAMMVSFSPMFLRGFFGDTQHTDNYHMGLIDDSWYWGFRHTLYFLMCISLFIIQAVKICVWVDKNINKFD